MKKCKGCHQEIDKFAIACDYCGKLNEERESPETDGSRETGDADEKNPENNQGP